MQEALFYHSANSALFGLGKRTVTEARSYGVPAGDFEACFAIAEDYNTGDYSHWFCLGIGIVERKSDHSGFPFGYRDILMDYRFPNP